MKRIQIIFLDVDGVLTSERCNGYYDFDLWAVHFLRWACEKSGAKIVMSSAWRVLPEAKEIFTKVFGKYLHEDWRTGEDYTRGKEIDEWMSRHPEVSENIVIIDDTMHGLEKHVEWLVFTTLEDGLLSRHMHNIKTRLGIRGGLPRLEKVFRDDVCFFTEREKRAIGYAKWIDELSERNERKTLDKSA